MIEKISKILTSDKTTFVVIGIILGVLIEGISLYCQGYITLP